VKTLVHVLSASVRRFPWVVIAVTIVLSLVFGFFGSEFRPADNANEGFAPEAPEIVAERQINELFGAESNQSVMQAIISSDRGDVITLDGLAAAEAVSAAVARSELAPYLVSNGDAPPIVHFLTPVEFAIAQGAPRPTTDAEVKAIYRAALEEMPAQQAGLVRGLLPASADPTVPSAPSGLMIVFTTGAAGPEEFDSFVAAAAAGAAAMKAAPVPDGVSVEPFSFELLFAGDSEFQKEIGRLFATAGFIIFLVLSIIFLVRPRDRKDRLLSVVGLVGMSAAVVVLLVPGLAVLFPDLLGESLADVATGPLLLFAAAVFVGVYLIWTLSSRGLRRTTADTLITLLTIAAAITWMNGYGYLRFGAQSQMVQILPILLIGLGVDYAIHVNTRYREEMSAGATVDVAISTAIRTVGIALVLATVTTAVGFLTNLTNDIPALREFGELAAFGILASFLLMLTFVPAIRELLDRRAERRGTLDAGALEGGQAKRLPRLVGRAAWLPKHAAVGTLVASLVLGGLGAYGTSKVEAKFSFLDFIPVTSPLRQTFETLLTDYGGGFGEQTQVLVTGDPATAGAFNAMVAATSNMTDDEGVVLVDGFPAAESPVALVAQLANPQSPSFDPVVAQAAGAAGMQTGSLAVAPEADVVALYDTLFAQDPERAARVLHRSDSGYDAALFTITTQAGESGAARLRDALIDDFAPVREVGLDAVPTSDEIVSNVIVTTLQNSQLSSLLLTLVAALILLVINFWYESRRPMLGVLTTVPVVLVVLWSFGVMAAAGIPFGPVTATISALAIGIGVPYMIHVTHRYLEDRARTPSAEEAVEQTLVHTGGALAGSALTTIAGFGVLATSSTIPFRQFGIVTAYTILLALFAAVLVLPTYLVLWDRWHRRRGEDPVDTDVLAEALEATRP